MQYRSFTELEKLEIEAMVESDIPVQKIAEHFETTIACITKNITKRKGGRRPGPNYKPDPTPEEIARRAARIRREWSDKEYRKRAGLIENWHHVFAKNVKDPLR